MGPVEGQHLAENQGTCRGHSGLWGLSEGQRQLCRSRNGGTALGAQMATHTSALSLLSHWAPTFPVLTGAGDESGPVCSGNTWGSGIPMR